MTNQEDQKFAKVEEIVIHIKCSNSGQHNAGSVRDHFRSEGDFCPLRRREEKDGGRKAGGGRKEEEGKRRQT